jgi:hypothetical protein
MYEDIKLCPFLICATTTLRKAAVLVVNGHARAMTEPGWDLFGGVMNPITCDFHLKKGTLTFE